MLQPDANETNKLENSSPGMTEGIEDQRFVCLPLTRDFQFLRPKNWPCHTYDRSEAEAR